MVVQHVLDVTGVTVQVEGLRDLALLLGIVERHHRKDWLNVQIKPGEQGEGEERGRHVSVIGGGRGDVSVIGGGRGM